MADLLYQIGRVGAGKYEKADTVSGAIAKFGEHFSALTAPFQLRVNDGKWSADRNKRDTLARAREVVKGHDAGLSVAVRGSKPSEPHFVLKVMLDSLGNVVVRYAKEQLGVPYVWAAVDPAGPAGGPGAGLDCSGLVIVCYAKADVLLPHNSEAIRQDNRVTLFGDKHKVKPGDVVFFHTDDRNGPNAASHIAICLDSDRMIVAPRTGEVVQRQAISSVGGFMAFGFIKAVTGTH